MNRYSVCIACGLSLAIVGCSSEECGISAGYGSERLIIETSGVEYFYGYGYHADECSVNRFYYGDENRHSQRVPEYGELSNDFVLTGDTPDHICLSGVRIHAGMEEPVSVDTELKSGREVRIDYTDAGMGLCNQIYRFFYSEAEGTLTQCQLPHQGLRPIQCENRANLDLNYLA